MLHILKFYKKKKQFKFLRYTCHSLISSFYKVLQIENRELESAMDSPKITLYTMQHMYVELNFKESAIPSTSLDQ